MINIFYKKHRCLSIPASQEELTQSQFIQLAPVLHQGGEEVECKVKALRILSGLSTFRWRMLDPEMINKSLSFTDWLFAEDLRITRQLIPEYRGYHGPVSDFDNMRMGEFHFSELHFKEYVLSMQENPRSLDMLVAVLYRKPAPGYDKKLNPSGDKRMAFNDNLIAQNANKIARWPVEVKLGIFTWYAACRQNLVDNNKPVFEDNGENIESQYDTGYYGVMRCLAGDKLGTLEQIEKMFVHTAMLELGLMKEEEKRFEAEMKKSRK